MKKSRVAVSDHALIRYLERVYKLDVELVRRELGRKIDRTFREGACAVTIDGYTYRVADGTVTTVLLASRPDLRLGRQRAERGE